MHVCARVCVCSLGMAVCTDRSCVRVCVCLCVFVCECVYERLLVCVCSVCVCVCVCVSPRSITTDLPFKRCTPCILDPLQNSGAHPWIHGTTAQSACCAA